jgi:predicted nucleic acid-binding protein
VTAALLLDSEALSRLLREDSELHARVQAARHHDAPVYTSAMTVIEAAGPQVHPARVSFVLSRLRVEPVIAQDAAWAHRILTRAGLHGHKYAIDAALSALALRLPVTNAALLTSDPADFPPLLGEEGMRKVRIIPLT